MTGSIDPYKQTDLLNTLATTARQYMMQNNNLAFEGLLLRFNIPLTPYIDNSKFEEFCLKLGLTFTSEEIRLLI